MKSVLLIVLVTILSACSGTKEKQNSDTQEVSPAVQTELPGEIEALTEKAEFGGNCTWNLCMRNQKVPCKGEYKLTYQNKIYYFDTLEHMQDFRKNIKKNLRQAERRWQAFDRNSSKGKL